MYKIKMKFWCNSGLTEEIVEIEIENTDTEEQQIQEAFHKWLDNNENVGFERVE